MSYSFSWAIQALKNKQKVMRTYWNGQGRWLELCLPKNSGSKFIMMHDTKGKIVPWEPNTDDCLEEDWCMYEHDDSTKADNKILSRLPSGHTVTPEQISDLIAGAQISVSKLGEKTALVCAKLENGFELVATSSAVDPSRYNEEVGKHYALETIKKKLWELEGYYLQKKLYEDSKH